MKLPPSSRLRAQSMSRGMRILDQRLPRHRSRHCLDLPSLYLRSLCQRCLRHRKYRWLWHRVRRQCLTHRLARLGVHHHRSSGQGTVQSLTRRMYPSGRTISRRHFVTSPAGFRCPKVTRMGMARNGRWRYPKTRQRHLRDHRQMWVRHCRAIARLGRLPTRLTRDREFPLHHLRQVGLGSTRQVRKLSLPTDQAVRLLLAWARNHRARQKARKGLPCVDHTGCKRRCWLDCLQSSVDISLVHSPSCDVAVLYLWLWRVSGTLRARMIGNNGGGTPYGTLV